MKIFNKKYIGIVSIIISTVGLVLFSYQPSQYNVHKKNKLTIVATTSMLTDAVRNIVGDNMMVHGLMGCGIDPHVYRARESDVHKLAAADLVVYNGLHLEGKMGQVLEGMSRFTAVVNASDAFDKNM